MISNGNTTVSVTDMDAALGFYVDRLGFALTNRFGRQWATVHAGPSYWTEDTNAGLAIGLRPAPPGSPAPGARGALMLGFETSVPIDEAIGRLRRRGVRIDDTVCAFDAGKTVEFEDPDGNPIYLWEVTADVHGLSDEERSDQADATATPVEGGHANLFVSNMDVAIRFYTETLGMRLTNRFGDNWTTVEAGRSLVIGLHPQRPKYPAPGTKGGMLLGLQVTDPIERVVSRLAARGVRFTGSIESNDSARWTTFEDPDGNRIEIRELVAPASAVPTPASGRAGN